MNKLKINFQLQELDKIMPFGTAPDLSLHWFGLTDGLLWIDVGDQTIYEYNEDARNYFGEAIRYNDYQVSRFLEDFFGIFTYVGESIPKELYDVLEELEFKMEKWKDCYIEEEDEEFERFYYDEYCKLGEWYWDRSIDSAHLVGGPYISCFRCEEQIKIIWESTYQLDNGNSIWTAPKGSFEMTYEEFISSITEFMDSFFVAMNIQVENAIKKEWEHISLDKERLVKENEERKSKFLQALSFLNNSSNNTDWKQVLWLCSKMEHEIEKTV